MGAPPAVIALFLLAPAGCLSASPFSGDDDDGDEVDAGTGDGGGEVGDDAGADASSCPGAAGFVPFADDFASGTFGWGEIGHAGSGALAEVGLSGGTLQFEPALDGDSRTWVRSVDSFDVRGLRVAMRVVETMAAEATTTSHFFLLQDGGGGEESMALSEGMLGAVGNTAAYNPDVHVWWQIRVEEDEDVFFETSVDGSSWEVFATITPTTFDFATSRLVVGVSVGTDQELAPGRLRIDDLNLTPDRCDG